ncbi:hypothetical protein [Desulfomonile tiedjei]|uniref:Uncharacterized protein n=1 Tax=Desulfomonile tiedjei (strain ATCC 49306 / DSM 6799 / DCB-1) TaxID=706587 RepID=I4CAL1_DESTA|nr:hypothetical protein [Desulfomonile tiedjei]AFM26602.1 hypothetical protein Desti_3960 [Desulfomonile tiedjei DSM 6799]
MDFDSFCDGMSAELATWKTRLHEVVQKFDNVESGDKTKMVPFVNDLHMILEEFDERIHKLRTECETAIEAKKTEPEGRFIHSRKAFEQADISPAEFGG